VFLDLLKNPTDFLRFWYFLGFLGIVFYIKSYGSGLWITGPWLILREREEVIGVFTTGATWWRSCRDGQTMTLNRGGQWCSDREMVPGTMRRDWSQVGMMDNGGALIMPFIGSKGGGRRAVKGREAVMVELLWRQLQEMETGIFWDFS
jgi:hypothetical protein